MSKGIYTGIIEKDDHGNYFCGEYLLDYQMVLKGFLLGDKITVKSLSRIRATDRLRLILRNRETLRLRMTNPIIIN